MSAMRSRLFTTAYAWGGGGNPLKNDELLAFWSGNHVA
jgi:hypothetical protein